MKTTEYQPDTATDARLQHDIEIRTKDSLWCYAQVHLEDGFWVFSHKKDLWQRRIRLNHQTARLESENKWTREWSPFPEEVRLAIVSRNKKTLVIYEI